MQQGAEQPGRASHGTQEVCSGVEQGRAKCGGVWCVEGGTTKEKGACACGLAVCGLALFSSHRGEVRGEARGDEAGLFARRVTVGR